MKNIDYEELKNRLESYLVKYVLESDQASEKADRLEKLFPEQCKHEIESFKTHAERAMGAATAINSLLDELDELVK